MRFVNQASKQALLVSSFNNGLFGLIVYRRIIFVFALHYICVFRIKTSIGRNTLKILLVENNLDESKMLYILLKAAKKPFCFVCIKT